MGFVKRLGNLIEVWQLNTPWHNADEVGASSNPIVISKITKSELRFLRKLAKRESATDEGWRNIENNIYSLSKYYKADFEDVFRGRMTQSIARIDDGYFVVGIIQAVVKTISRLYSEEEMSRQKMPETVKELTYPEWYKNSCVRLHYYVENGLPECYSKDANLRSEAEAIIMDNVIVEGKPDGFEVNGPLFFVEQYVFSMKWNLRPKKL